MTVHLAWTRDETLCGARVPMAAAGWIGVDCAACLATPIHHGGLDARCGVRGGEMHMSLNWNRVNCPGCRLEMPEQETAGVREHRVPADVSERDKALVAADLRRVRLAQVDAVIETAQEMTDFWSKVRADAQALRGKIADGGILGEVRILSGARAGEAGRAIKRWRQKYDTEFSVTVRFPDGDERTYADRYIEPIGDQTPASMWEG